MTQTFHSKREKSAYLQGKRDGVNQVENTLKNAVKITVEVVLAVVYVWAIVVLLGVFA